ncbi:hypothetical protein ACOMHN_019386 [Nucella lapillus]
MIAANGYLRKKIRKLPAFNGPMERNTRLDWILYPNRFKNSAVKVRNIRPSIVKSDHHLLVLDVSTKWPRSKRSTPSSDWQSIDSNDIKENFLQDFWSNRSSGMCFSDAVTESIENHIPKRKPDRSNSKWLDDPMLVDA